MSAEDNLSKQLFYHSSPTHNRESIERDGLIPSKRFEGARKGVYMMPDHPNVAYGDDIYEMTPSKNTVIHDDPIDQGGVFSRKKIPTSDFKRVGHLFSAPHLKTDFNILGEEIHWHKEEDCPDTR